MLKGKSIICFGTADWDNPFRTNQHHIMERLSRNNRVLFIESLGLRRPVMQKKDISRMLSRLMKGLSGVRKIGENLFVFSPLVLPFHKYRVVRSFNNLLLRRALKAITAKYEFKNNIIWSYAPGIGSLMNVLDRRLVVYHCVDELSANPLIPKVIKEVEEEFISDSADLVFVTSRSLYDSKHRFSDNVHYLPNVADFKHFNSAASNGGEAPDDIKDIRKPVAGFVGAVSRYKLDFSLLRYLAENLPDVSFVFIGPSGEGEKAVNMDKIAEFRNIFFLGPKPYDELPCYLSEFDVCLLPNKINKYTENMFPMKFFEYLAGGKPVVATGLPALKDFTDYFYEASGMEEFAKKIKMALEEDSKEKSEKRIKLASGHTWEKRINEMSEIIEDAWKRRLIKNRLNGDNY